jgi:glucokinase
VRVVAGIDLGGTAINYTFLDAQGTPLIDGLCEYPAKAKEGPDVCLSQIAAGFQVALERIGLTAADVAVVGLDTPGPASSDGVLSARGSTNFIHAAWASFDIRAGLSDRLKKTVLYLNDANAAALWGHATIFGAGASGSSISAIIGTGLGGGVIIDGQIVKGRKGFGGELGHVLLPYQSISGIAGMNPACNCGRTGDLESLCSLTAIGRTFLPYFLPKFPGHELSTIKDLGQAAKMVRGLAEHGDPLCKEIFRVQAHALGLFFDEMVNTFDPDALLIGGGALETNVEFQEWFISEIRNAMPKPREEQADILIRIMPNGDTAGARGAAAQALAHAKIQRLL